MFYGWLCLILGCGPAAEVVSWLRSLSLSLHPSSPGASRGITGGWCLSRSWDQHLEATFQSMPPNSNHQPQEGNHPGRKRFQCQKKPLRSLRAAVITCVQVYHETKIHIIVAVIMERRKAFVAQRWEENGCIQTELSISSRQTSLYSWLLKQALQLSGKL